MTIGYLGPEDVLSVDDVPELPNGMATIVTVRAIEGTLQVDAQIDDYGRLRALAPAHTGQFFPNDQWEVMDR